MRCIVVGQKVNLARVEKARELRCRMTVAERALWQRLRANRLRGLHFRRQQIVGPYIVDFYCHAAGLVVEVDGAVHGQQREYDEARAGLLAARGLRVMRVTNEMVLLDLEGVLERIAQACADQRGSPPL